MRQRLTRAEGRVQTRVRLLKSAAELFAHSGYEGASVDLIAESAGFSKGAFYSNFDSKESIFLELLQLHKENEIAALTAMLAGEGSADDLLKRLREFCENLEVDMDWGLLSAEFQIQACRDSAFAKRYAKLFLEHRDALAQLIAALFRKLDRPEPLDSVGLADILMAMTAGLSLQRGGVKGSLPKYFLRDAILFVLNL